MAKFGLFTLNGDKPTQEYEGDYLEQANEIVKIFKKQVNSPSLMMAAINLDKGQSVKEVKN